MNRAHLVAATLVSVVSVSGAASLARAQTQTTPPKAPEFKQVLAGKKLIPPVRGDAQIDFVRTSTKREGTTLVTKIQVKNTSNAPIARLTRRSCPASGSSGQEAARSSTTSGRIWPAARSTTW